MKEKRSLPRVNVVAYYKITDLESDRDMGQVTDITTEGMRLQGQEPMEVNTTCRFKMTVPEEDNMNGNLLFDANVVWCQESMTPGMYDSGIRLQNISSEDSHYLQQIVENIPFERQHLEIHRPRPMEY